MYDRPKEMNFINVDVIYLSHGTGLAAMLELFTQNYVHFVKELCTEVKVR